MTFSKRPATLFFFSTNVSWGLEGKAGPAELKWKKKKKSTQELRQSPVSASRGRKGYQPPGLQGLTDCSYIVL